jgi:acetyltransferase-like isoleucine patch superfamily enzyme
LSSFLSFLEIYGRYSMIWEPCNIYKTAILGNNCSVGMFSEIGHNVVVGENTRIGMGVFIPEGVTIGKNCFIGPKTCFSNDMYPPSPRNEWQKTVVKDGASIGANVSVRPGVTIGKNALVGMGSVVVCDIPDDEVWAGNPAEFLRRRWK